MEGNKRTGARELTCSIISILCLVLASFLLLRGIATKAPPCLSSSIPPAPTSICKIFGNNQIPHPKCLSYPRIQKPINPTRPSQNSSEYKPSNSTYSSRQNPDQNLLLRMIIQIYPTIRHCGCAATSHERQKYSFRKGDWCMCRRRVGYMSK